MDDDAFETQLASEGGNASFAGADRDALLLAFFERFALAADMREKHDVVNSTLIVGTPEALYYNALCDLLELQMLVTAQGNQPPEAMQLLESKRNALMATIGLLEATHQGEADQAAPGAA